MQLIFNELSLNPNLVDKYQGEKLLTQFILTYSESIKNTYGFSRSILTSVDLNSMQLTGQYCVSQWRNSPHTDRDLLRRFVNMCDRQTLIDFSQDEAEITCEKGRGVGLLAAYEYEAACLSFVYDQFWDNTKIECSYYSLNEDKSYSVSVMNYSNPIHFQQNFEMIWDLRNKQAVEITTPAELLDQLENLFPSLVFHRVTKDQLKYQIERQHVSMLCNKLMMLEKYFSTWDGNKFDETVFPTKSVSPQSKETLDRFKKEHTFTFKDKSILVSYHIRYTGNIPGRIYFHPDNETQKGYICSLTTKLPCVSNPKSKI